MSEQGEKEGLAPNQLKDLSVQDKTTVAIPLMGGQEFYIPEPKPSRHVTGLILYFATYQQTVHGMLRLQVKCGHITSDVFTINISSIRDNAPVLLLIHKDIPKGLPVYVLTQVEYQNQGQLLAIWTDQGIPTHCLKGEEERDINLEGNAPKIGVITAVYHTPIALLQAAADSMFAQTFPKWEWYISVDDAAEQSPELREALKTLKERDPDRIRVIGNVEHLGISRAQNKALQALKKSNCEWFLTLDHDDLLHPEALAEVARAAVQNPHAALIYSDENKVSEDGLTFRSPFYKPDWSPALLLCHNYICHLCAFKVKRVIEKEVLFDFSFDGAQDYQFLLSYLGKDPGVIIHIPRVLYHWREVKGSTSMGSHVKPLAEIRGHRAVTQYLEQHIMPHGTARVYTAPGHRIARPDIREVLRGHSGIEVDIIIPTKDHLDTVKVCLETLAKADDGYGELSLSTILVDNGSVDKKGALALYRKFTPPDQIVYEPMPFNFSKQVNMGASLSHSDFILLLNNDTEICDPQWLREMVSWMIAFPDIGVVGARLLYPDGRLQHGGVDMGVGGLAGHTHKYLGFGSGGYFNRVVTVHETSCVTGACMLIRRSVFEEVGGFDESIPKAFNDVDFCLKVRQAGWRILYTPWAVLYHHESLSRGIDDGKDPEFIEVVQRMQKKWGPQIARDPYFHPVFSRATEGYACPG